MTRMITDWNRRDWCAAFPNAEDRRAANLELTAAGRALYPHLIAAKERVQAQFLRGFGANDVRTLETLLKRMLENR